MRQTLLQRAKQIKKSRKKVVVASKEEIELAISWLKGEIQYVQINTVLEISGSNIYNFLARSIRYAYQLGLIKIKNE